MTNNPSIFNAEPYADLRVRKCMEWKQETLNSLRSET
jgi:hypothetical protein